jgi:hypothetical protein
MSQFSQYSEAGPSSQIASSQIDVGYPNEYLTLGLNDPSLTPDQSISQQTVISVPASDFPPPISIPLTLRRIGPNTRKPWVIYTEMYKKDFLEWWLQTAGASPLPPVHKVNFEAKYTSTAWDNFDQVAHHITGKPMALCRRCGKALPHPSGTSNGVNSLARHFKSKSCQKASDNTTIQQNIQESLQLAV